MLNSSGISISDEVFDSAIHNLEFLSEDDSTDMSKMDSNKPIFSSASKLEVPFKSQRKFSERQGLGYAFNISFENPEQEKLRFC